MGQKSNPTILRIGVNKTWSSIWFTNKKNFSNYIIEDYNIRKFIFESFAKNIIEKVNIERLHNKCIVSIFTPKPGFLIGKKGSDIDVLRKNISKLSKTSVSINISEVKKPELSSPIVAASIALQIEKRVSYKKAIKRAISQALRMGAKGIKISCSGRLGGAEIARCEFFKDGRVPLHTFRDDIDYSHATAYTAYGVCGIKVWINK